LYTPSSWNRSLVSFSIPSDARAQKTYSFDKVEITRRTWSSNWNPSEGTWDVEWGWTIIEENDSKTIHEHQKLKSYTYQYLKEKLQEVGFRNIEKKDNRRLLIKAEKID
jgi:hypothetical protein